MVEISRRDKILKTFYNSIWRVRVRLYRVRSVGGVDESHTVVDVGGSEEAPNGEREGHRPGFGLGSRTGENGVTRRDRT